MNSYAALLRAINVGGRRKILMTDLRELLTRMGLIGVTTYIQSGNVVFTSHISDAEELGLYIEESLKTGFGHDVAVMIRTREQLEKLVGNNPFETQLRNPYMLYVTFFREFPSPALQKKIEMLSNEYEVYNFVNGELFSLIDKKTDKKVHFSNNFVEKTAGVQGTTRNWNSVIKILDLSRKLTA
jgi:uncharacterized protein (DUF1697 family)